MPRARQVNADALRAILAARDHATALELASELDVSRPTISRLLGELGPEIVRLGAARQARYSLRRQIRDLGQSWPVHRVDEQGQLQPVATLEAVRGGFRLSPVPAILRSDYPDGYFSGLPFIFADSQPQGFLGRVQARQASGAIGVPSDPRDWSADDTLAYLLSYGDDLPGDLVIGEDMAARIRGSNVGAITNPLRAAIPAPEREQRYPELAERIIRGETFGSSAGGEQPKFATWVLDEGAIPRAVIVKFSPATGTLAGRRWADLLLCESIALDVLRDAGIAAPPVQVIDAGLRRFLEVTRYDRVGPRGRRGVISVGSVEAGLIAGAANGWVGIADALAAARLLDPDNAQRLRRLWCFGQLIGNNDMHAGNASLWWRDDGQLALAPVYDMLPMVFGPSAQGELVNRNFILPERTPALNSDWDAVVPWALDFWSKVLEDQRISQEFKVLAEAARDRVRAFRVSPPPGLPPAPPPASLSEQFPRVAAALHEQKVRADVIGQRDPARAGEIKTELASLLAAGHDLGPLVSTLFPGGISPEEFARFSLGGYGYLGVGDEVRAFVGKLWTDMMRGWSPDERARFLSAILSDRFEVFEALDFAAGMFRTIEFPAEVMLPWLQRARDQLGNDLYQAGFWNSVTAFTTRSPVEAVKVAVRWLAAEPDDTACGVIARIVGQIRLEMRHDHPAKAEFDALEVRLRAAGRPEWRALFLESWSRAAGNNALSEQKLLQLRDELAGQGPDELAAWCFLLAVVVQSDPIAWPWAHRELAKVASPQLSASARFHIVRASMEAWEKAVEPEFVSREQWETLFLSVLPFGLEEEGLWNRLEYFLREIGQREEARLQPFIARVVAQAGRSWLKKFNARRFDGFIALLQERRLHEAVATQLCLTPASPAREIGLAIFARTHVARLEPTVLAAAEPKQIELIFREAQRVLVESPALARLHSCLAGRINQIGGDLAEAFYEEVELQTRNSHGYREALAKAAPDHPRLKDLLGAVDGFFKRLEAAAKSPALQIQVPGYRRAEQAFHRRFSREISKGVEKYSIFRQFAKTVQLLYGKQWRMMRTAGELSPSSALQELSHSTEMPRMEFLDPEGLRFRRLIAAARINELEGRR